MPNSAFQEPCEQAGVPAQEHGQRDAVPIPGNEEEPSHSRDATECAPALSPPLSATAKFGKRRLSIGVIAMPYGSCSAARSFYRTPRGSRRTLIRFEPKTTTAPAMSSASTVLKLKLASRSRSKLAAPRSGMRRKRITEGLALFRRASSVPKSVSSDSKIRPSRAASSKRTVSSADCRPRSRTCRASWPAARRPSARRGDSALSTRSLK